MATWWNDYKNSVLQGHSIFTDAPAQTSFFGVAVDMKEAQEGLHAQLHTGTITDGTHDIKLQESEDGSTNFTDIVDFLTGGVAAFDQLIGGDDNLNRTLNFKRSKRFVRARSTVVGTETGGLYAVSIHGLRRRVI